MFIYAYFVTARQISRAVKKCYFVVIPRLFCTVVITVLVIYATYNILHGYTEMEKYCFIQSGFFTVHLLNSINLSMMKPGLSWFSRNFNSLVFHLFSITTSLRISTIQVDTCNFPMVADYLVTTSIRCTGKLVT